MALTSAFTPLRIALSRLPSSVMSASCSGPSGEVPQALDPAPVEMRELHRGAAHVADQPVARPASRGARPWPASRASSGPLATWSCSPVSRSTWSQKRRPVRRLAHRGGRHGDHPRQLHLARPAPRSGAAPPSPRQPSRTQPPGVAEAGAEAAEHLLVVEIGRAPRHAVEDHEPHRIRPDVDHPDALQPSLGRVLQAGTAAPTPSCALSPDPPRPALLAPRRFAPGAGGVNRGHAPKGWRAPAFGGTGRGCVRVDRERHEHHPRR